LVKIDKPPFFEIIGMAAIVFPLVFVAWELRQSNRIALAGTEADLRTADMELAIRVAENPALAVIVEKLQNNSELSSLEDIQASSYATAAFATLAQANQANISGLLTGYSLDIYQTSIADWLDSTPGLAKYWFEIATYYDFQQGESPIWDTLLAELKDRGYALE